MKSAIDRLLRAGTASSSTRNGPVASFEWKQSPDGKWFKVGNVSHGTTQEDTCENALLSPSTSTGIEIRKCIVCPLCDTALHFRNQGDCETTRCSICNQACGTIQLVCSICGMSTCCSEAAHNSEVDAQGWKPSCYGSYFTSSEPLRAQLYNREARVSELSRDDQQLWLQCMWHDIVQDLNRFRVELYHTSQVDTINVSKVELVIQNLGIVLVKGLVRLFVIFLSKFDTKIVQWFSSLIQYERELLGNVALEASVSLNDRLEQVKWLIHTLELNSSNCQLADTVGIAAKMGRLEILECLIENGGADPSLDSNYAVQMASQNGHLNVVERLLQDERVDPSANFDFAIGMASQNGHWRVVERLLRDDRVDPAEDDNYAIRWASRNGSVNVVERLLQDDRVDPSVDECGAIRWASEKGHLHVVERLLQDVRVDPSADSNYAIRYASNYGHLDVVERLLQDARVDPSMHDNFALQAASGSGHLNVVERLLQDNRVDPSANNHCAIRFASRAGHLSVVKRLLQDDRVDPAARDNIAIQAASENGHLNVVERLLQDARVDPSVDDSYAIRYASRGGHLNVVERLLQDNRVDPAAHDNYAIQAASENGHLDVVERLLQDTRVDPSVDDNYAIRYASRAGHLSVVKRLLQDDRVDPVARGGEALQLARDGKIVRCLYTRTRNIVCFLFHEALLMKRISHLYNESLMVGGMCLNHTSGDTAARTTICLPCDIILVILLEWAALVK